jgi:hypothetical protein
VVRLAEQEMIIGIVVEGVAVDVMNLGGAGRSHVRLHHDHPGTPMTKRVSPGLLGRWSQGWMAVPTRNCRAKSFGRKAHVSRRISRIVDGSPGHEGMSGSLTDEINRVDHLASTIFSVSIGIAVAAIAAVFAVESELARFAAAAVGIVVAVVSLEVAPDVVFAPKEPDLSDDSLRAYLKRRRRITQFGAVFLAGMTYTAMVVGGAILFAEAVDPIAGIGAAVGGVLGAISSVATKSEREQFWPSSIRGRPPRGRPEAEGADSSQ